MPTAIRWPALPAPPPQVNGRIINKRIHVRIEHVRPSRCREEFLRRCKENDERKHAAKVAGGERARHSQDLPVPLLPAPQGCGAGLAAARLLGLNALRE